MEMRFYRFITLVMIQWLSLLQAEAITLHVVDQHGRSVEGAVVEFTGEQKTQKNNTLAIMDQVNKQFNPELLIVKLGDKVTFPNSDEIRHHVYSFSPAKIFELKLYKGKHGTPLVMDTAGVVILGCNIHDSMVGYIYVTPTTAMKTNTQGKLNFTPLEHHPITLWHPNQALELHTVTPIAMPSSHDNWQVTLNTQLPAPRDTFSERFKSNATVSP